MKIRHERPMSDLEFQVRAPLVLELRGGERIVIESWSLSGFVYPGECDLIPREATLSIPFQGVDIRFPVHLKRQGKDRFVAFEGLTGRQRETLALFYRSLLSGRMAAMDEVITSLDAPVDLVPMGETEEEEADGRANQTPRALRAGLTIVTYLCVAALALATLGHGIVTRLATVDIRNARVEAPVSEMLALQPGYVSDVRVARGDRVAAGDVLVRVTTPETEAGLAEVRGQIDLLERRLAEATNERIRVIDWIDRERDTLEAAVGRAIDTAGRIEADQALAAFDGRRSADHAALFEVENALGREIERIEGELRRLRRERGRLRTAADALHLTAREPGVVTDMMVRPGEFLSRGTPVVHVEGLDARVVRGWVRQDLAAALAPGMPTRVVVNGAAGPKRLEGQIANITAGIDPDLSSEFGMLVTVAFPTMTAAETRVELPHLMPVAVDARRNWIRRFDDWRQRLVHSVFG